MLRKLPFLTSALLCWLPPAHGQVRSRALDVVSWHVRSEPESVRPGGVVRLVFQAKLGEPDDRWWKMYALGSPLPSRAVAITLTDLPADVEQAGLVEQWGAESGYDQWFDTTVVYFERQALLWTDLKVGPGAAERRSSVHGTITFMVCSRRICLPPATRPFTVPVKIQRDASGVLSPAPPQYDPTIMERGPTPIPEQEPIWQRNGLMH